MYECGKCKQPFDNVVNVCGRLYCPKCGQLLNEEVDDAGEEDTHQFVQAKLIEEEPTSIVWQLIEQLGGNPDNEIWQAVVGDVVEEEKWMWIEEVLGVDVKVQYIEGVVSWEDVIKMVVECSEEH